MTFVPFSVTSIVQPAERGSVAGKSQLMKYAAKLSQRFVVTTGKGSSAAGLTVAAVKEGGQW